MSPPDPVGAKKDKAHAASWRCEELPPDQRTKLEKAPLGILDQFYLATPQTPTERDLFAHAIACDLAQIHPLRAGGILALLGAKDGGLMQQVLQRLKATVAPDQWSALSARVNGRLLIGASVGSQIDRWTPPYLKAAVYLTLQKGNNPVGQFLSIPGIENSLYVSGQMCYQVCSMSFAENRCDLFIINGQSAMAEQLRRSFSDFDPASRQRAVYAYQSLAVSFTQELYEQEAIALGEIAETGTTEEREATRACQYFLSSLSIERQRLSTPTTEAFDPSLQARPLRPEEFPRD